MSSTGVMQIPISEWNSHKRKIDKIYKKLFSDESGATAGWVRAGELMKRTGLTRAAIRYRKNEHNSKKTSSGHYIYDVNAFKN